MKPNALLSPDCKPQKHVGSPPTWGPCLDAEYSTAAYKKECNFENRPCKNLCEPMWVVVKIMAPFLGTLNIRCRILIRTQQGTLILTTTHMHTRPDRRSPTSDPERWHLYVGRMPRLRRATQKKGVNLKGRAIC